MHQKRGYPATAFLGAGDHPNGPPSRSLSPARSRYEYLQTFETYNTGRFGLTVTLQAPPSCPSPLVV